ncbi:carboxypeptidase-like regulatory domain-containing protein [Winogradskyella sp. Asnod2-B02-A]|uniref:carboxypeptidase-like regulatory domain-containing protein n=1 Tax=Winogradskyella sp. Asnod2-B02-A TaxID=3160583 RepID=UPI00386F392D
MRKSVTINIAEPCHEDWRKMTPKNEGRHCAACSKTVVDFTTQTDEQIIKSLEANENLCGRFKTQQLDREIVMSRKAKNNYLSLAASGLFAFLALGNQHTYAQGEPIKTETIIRPMVKGKVATSILNEHIYFGTVTTAIDGLPLPGASIIVKGTSRSAQTDFDGNFTIKGKIGEILELSYVGMETQNIPLNTKYELKVVLENDSCFNDYAAVGFVSYNYQSNNDCKRKKRKAKRLAKREAIEKGEQERTSFGKFFYGIKRIFMKK